MTLSALGPKKVKNRKMVSSLAPLYIQKRVWEQRERVSTRNREKAANRCLENKPLFQHHSENNMRIGRLLLCVSAAVYGAPDEKHYIRNF